MAQYTVSGSSVSAWLGLGPGHVGVFDDEGPGPMPGDVVALWPASRPGGPPFLLRLALPPFPEWTVKGPKACTMFVSGDGGALKCFRPSYIGRLDRLIEVL